MFILLFVKIHYNSNAWHNLYNCPSFSLQKSMTTIMLIMKIMMKVLNLLSVSLKAEGTLMVNHLSLILARNALAKVVEWHASRIYAMTTVQAFYVQL